MIKLGVCAAPDKSAPLAEAGFDYIECGLSAIAALGDDEYKTALDALLKSPIRAEAFNIMMPASVPVVGPDARQANVRAYLDLALPRAAAMGCKVIVFGSGGARKVPEGYAACDAYDDLVAFLRAAGDRCGAYGIDIAIEPLNTSECNILNSVSEAVWIARRADHKNVKVLIDNYHAEKERQSLHEVRAAGAYMAHAHVSHPDRGFPRPGDGYDYSAYFAALKDIGYTGRMSVEGRTDDFESDIVNAFSALCKHK